MPTCANLSPSLQHDDQQPVVLRRRSSSDLARQKFGTMPLLPIRGDDSGATLLSANQTLVRSQPPPPPQAFLDPCLCPIHTSEGSGAPASLGSSLCLLCAPTPHLLLPGLTVSPCLSLLESPPHLCPAATSQSEDPVHVLCEYCACSSCTCQRCAPLCCLSRCAPCICLQATCVCVCVCVCKREKE